MSRPSGPPFRLSAVQEAMGLWALGFLGIILAFLLAGGTSVPKLVATVGFLFRQGRTNRRETRRGRAFTPVHEGVSTGQGSSQFEPSSREVTAGVFKCSVDKLMRAWWASAASCRDLIHSISPA